METGLQRLLYWRIWLCFPSLGITNLRQFCDHWGTILETEYIPSKQNVVCDGLSRGVQPSELGLDDGLWVHMPEAGPVVQYIRACDPRLTLTTWPQVIDHMGLCHHLLSRI